MKTKNRCPTCGHKFPEVQKEEESLQPNSPKIRTIILENKIQCKKCGDIIESTYTHDFKWCSCQSVAVDGGHDYLRRVSKNEDSYIDLSITKTVNEEEWRKEIEEKSKHRNTPNH